MCVENGGEVTVRWGEALCWEVRQKVPEGQGVCGVFDIRPHACIQYTNLWPCALSKSCLPYERSPETFNPALKPEILKPLTLPGH